MIWDNISAALRGVGGVGIGVGRGGKLKVLQGADVGMKSGGTYESVACVAGAWTRVGSRTITPQTTQRWGYGREGVSQSNIGILYFLPKVQAGTAIPCAVRLAIVDAEDRIRDYIIHAVRSEKLAKDLTDGKDLVFFLPENGIMGREDDKMVLEIMVDTNATLSGTVSTFRADTTIYI